MLNKYLVEFFGTLFFVYIILATGNAVAIGAAPHRRDLQQGRSPFEPREDLR